MLIKSAFMSEICGNSNFHQRFYIVFLGLVGIGLGGCATTNDKQLNQAHLNLPLKVLVIESPVAIDPGRLQAVFAPDITAKLSVSDEPIAQAVKHAQEHALAVMDSVMTKQPRLIAITPKVEDKQLIHEIQGYPFETAIPQEAADRIRMSTGADALLRFDITDYGLTPLSWRNGYITFEVTSTLALAAAIAYSGSTVAKAAAGAYLVQEAVEETAEAYAGFWALDVVSRPVRIEAELIRLNPVTTVWNTSDTGLSEVKLSRLTRKVEADERNSQLDQATDDAVKDVVSDLSDALEKIKSEHN